MKFKNSSCNKHKAMLIIRTRVWIQLEKVRVYFKKLKRDKEKSTTSFENKIIKSNHFSYKILNPFQFNGLSK